MKTTIYIDNEGNVSGLADDVFDRLTSLGVKQVERVSNIEFDHKQQLWVATDNTGVVIASHPSRKEVINLERCFLNKKIEEGFTLNS